MNRHYVSVRYYDRFKRQKFELFGFLIELDQKLRRIKILHGEEVEWILWDDIREVRFLSDEQIAKKPPL